jgi:tetratricopeptide (TPR) repeat protein
MGLFPENIKNFFDDPRAPADILKEASEFLVLRQRELESHGQAFSDLLFYFVGHGGFVAPDDAYCLFVRFTQERLLRTTSLHITDLAEVFREHARHLRGYFILDACFAGAAPRFIFQSSRGEMIRRELAQQFPRKGMALLCSSSGQHVSKAPRGEPFTMFTGTLLNILTRNHPREEERLSLRALGRLTADLIRERYEDAAVRPEVHSPDQRDGDLADVPLFPNLPVTAPSAAATTALDDRLPATAAGIEQVLSRLGIGPFVFPRPALAAEAARRLRDGPLSGVVLHGLAGIGKTMLLAEVVRELGREVGPIVVLRFEGPAALEPAYILEEINAFLTAAGRGLAVRQLAEQRPERVLITLAAQLADVRALAVLDGLETSASLWPETVLRGLLAAARVRVLGTARRRLNMERVHPLPVPPLSDAEATAFVAEYQHVFPVETDPEALVRRLSPGIRSHPQALATLLAQLSDFPLDLVLATGMPEEVCTPLRLVEQAVAALEPPQQATLALVGLLDGLDLSQALHELGLPPPAGLLRSLQVLLARSLVHRAGMSYTVPAIVCEAMFTAAPAACRAAAEQVASAWQRVLAVGGPTEPNLASLAAVGVRVIHRLGGWAGAKPAHELLTEAFLERLNVAGLWKEYSLLLRLGWDAARHSGDRAARVRHGFRLTRKLLQTGDPTGARTTLAEVATLVDPSAETLEVAEMHSHRALVCQLDRDEEGMLHALHESGRIRKRLDDRAGQAVVEKLLGNIYVQRKEYAAARHAFEAVQILLADRPDSKELVEAETSLAAVDLAEGQVEAAEGRLRAARVRCQELRYEAGLPRVSLNLALVLERQKRLAEAAELAGEAARRAGETDRGIFEVARLTADRLRRQMDRENSK